MKRLLSLLPILLFLIPSLAPAEETTNGKAVRLPDEMKIYSPVPYAAKASFSKGNAAWSLFKKANPQWVEAWNELTHNPHRAWGPGIRIEGFTHITATNAEQAGWQFIHNYAPALNAKPTELRLIDAAVAGGKWYYTFKQTYQGLDVLNTFIDLRVSSDGKVFMFGSDFIHGIDVRTTPSISRDAARELAKVGLTYRPGRDGIHDGEMYILPLMFDANVDCRLVYNFVVHESTDEIWNTYVDAHSGAVLWRFNLVMNAMPDEPKRTAGMVTGKVMTRIWPVSYLYADTVVPSRNQNVTIAGKTVVTNDKGEFTVDIGDSTSATMTTVLAGPYFNVRRGDGGRNAFITSIVTPGQHIDILWGNNNSHAAERNAFYHLNTVRDYNRMLEPGTLLQDIDRTIPATVRDASDSCNASWNGGQRMITYLVDNPSCADFATIAAVTYHEFGHAINQFFYQRKRNQAMTNGALNEGTADVNANLLEDSPLLGPGSIPNGPWSGSIRNADHAKKYPDDIQNEVHYDGEIIAGAVWDLRKNVGLDLARRLTHQCKYGTPDGTSAGDAFFKYFLEVLIADDDDANIVNGTPHSAQIIPAFVKHGIPGTMSLAHVPIKDQDGTANGYPYTVNATVTMMQNVAFVTIAPQTLTLNWTLDNWKHGYTKSSPATGTVIQETFPQQQIGSIVRYYFDVTDTYGIKYTLPKNAPLQSYLFLVGYKTKLFHDMETNQGWVVDPDQNDDAETGIWGRLVPIGTAAQPDSDHTPGAQNRYCYITGNASAGAGLGQNDVDDGKTTLQSPALDMTQYRNPVIRYWRWYNNAPPTGANPNQDTWLVQISSDDGATWTDLERTTKSIADWAAFVFPVRDYIQPTSKVRVRFVASDADPQSLVEAAVDDFEILDTDAVPNSIDDARALTNFHLAQSYPNPVFNRSQTQIDYRVAERSFVTLKLFDRFGKEVATLVSGEHEVGWYTSRFTPQSLPAGIYFYELRSGDARFVQKMTVLQ